MKTPRALRPIRLMLLAISGVALASCDPIDTFSDIVSPTPEATHEFVLQADLEGVDLGDDPDAKLLELIVASNEALAVRLTTKSTTPLKFSNNGDGKLVITMAGDRSPELIKQAIADRGELALRLVDMDALPMDTMKGIAPPGSEILTMAQDGTNIAVKRIGGISGKSISDARTVANRQTGSPVVSILLDEAGGRKLAMITSQNVGSALAIVLDNKVLSAPIISEPILGGQVELNGGFTAHSAEALAARLRSGPLPLTFTLIEERILGAS